MALIGFLITISILVVIHEFGHYLFARLFKVKVITFSVGFGPKLLSWKGRHNQWCISAIPLGGYVQMLDEREGNVEPHLKHFAFNNKPPIQKLLIALAGPLFNILFAFLAYYFIGLYGVYNLKPVISSISPTPLVKNLELIKPNSTITKINGQSPDSWNQAENIFDKTISTNNNVIIDLTNAVQAYQVTLDIRKYKENSDNPGLANMGLYPFSYIPQIAYIEPQSAAAKAGLKENDLIIQINSTPINNWFQVTNIIRSSPSENLKFIINRNNKKQEIVVTPYSSTDDDGQIIGKVGIMPTLDKNLIEQNSYIKHYGFISSMGYAANACFNLAQTNLSMLWLMIKGKVSWHNVGGPITIAKASQTAIYQGVKSFVDFLALISLSLAIMNLLPIPVLDGGHIIIYAIEWLTGKPISIGTQQILFKFGLIVVLGVTFLALYNDFLKLFNL